MKIPPEQEIQKLQNEFDILPGIIDHCHACAKKSLDIAQRMLKKGRVKKLDLQLIELGARLHDLAKPVTIQELKPEKYGLPPAIQKQIKKWKKLKKKYPYQGHELEVLAKIIHDQGYEEFAKFLLSLGWTGNPTYLKGLLETKIIHYANWTLQGDKEVDFKYKVDYCIELYKNRWAKKPDEWWGEFRKNEIKLEKEILALL